MYDAPSRSERGAKYLDQVIAKAPASHASQEAATDKPRAKSDAGAKTKAKSSGRPVKALRRPVCYQTYAADDLAAERYYLMTLAERGLFDVMRRVCWVNDSIPADHEGIGLAIRRPWSEVKDALSHRVLSHFAKSPGDATRLVCTELAGQMEEMMERRQKQSEGGLRGAKTTNSEKPGRSPGKPPSKPPASELSRSEASLEEEAVVEPVVVEDVAEARTSGDGCPVADDAPERF